MLINTISETKLLHSIVAEKMQRDTEYLMELKTENLLWAFYAEAGLNGWLNFKPTTSHGGWDSPTSQIRGTFTGHWMSAAARIYSETNNQQLKAKADFIVSEIARCQAQNGGLWAFSIPEKYLYSLKEGKHFWAPQYVCHKVMMGLLDMYQFAKNETALDIILKCAEWFTSFTDDISRETMTIMMDSEETGGLMEFWADLYSVTNNSKHLELMKRYERPALFEPIFNGKDVITNMHANTTVPEIHGCARAYEVTGDEYYKTVVQNFWDIAVTKRGMFATGGQTNGEVWAPMGRQEARLGTHNQEHCVVYNMIRLADYLFKWTGDAKYADYIEQNIYNGVLAQTFIDYISDENAGIVTYYLPLEAGSKKNWGSKTEDFWCCHCSAVQANARFREFIYYKENNDLVVAQYIPATLNTSIKGANISVEQTYFDLGGECIKIKDIAISMPVKPEYVKMQLAVKADKPTLFSLKLRLPWWIKSDAVITVNGSEFNYVKRDGYALIECEWNDDIVTIELPKGITCLALADEPNTVAFLDGPVVLAGLISEERQLVGDINDPSTLIKPHNERLWSSWITTYKTVNQPVGFYLKPLYEVNREYYTVYFPIKKI